MSDIIGEAARRVYGSPLCYIMAASQAARSVKNPPAMQETQVQSLSGEDPLEKEMVSTPVFLPG